MLEWTASEISDLCKNCGHLAVAKTTSLENEVSTAQHVERSSKPLFKIYVFVLHSLQAISLKKLGHSSVAYCRSGSLAGKMRVPLQGPMLPFQATRKLRSFGTWTVASKPHTGLCFILKRMVMPRCGVRRYLLLRAADKFYDECGYYPGYTDDTLESDVQSMRKFVDSVLDDFGLPSHLVSSAHVQEICRFGAAELHTEAAFVGGAAAQTVTILVSRQFVPIEGVLVHNGINGSSQMLELFD